MRESERKSATQGRSALLAKLERYSQSDTAYHIQAHWQKRGHPDVRVWVEMVKLPGRDSRLEIRSNLLNGRPRRGGEGEGRRNPQDSRQLLQYSKSSYDERLQEKECGATSHDRDGVNSGIDGPITLENRPTVWSDKSQHDHQCGTENAADYGAFHASGD